MSHKNGGGTVDDKELKLAVSQEKRTWILSILSDIEAQMPILFLFASESGSRAWGVYSPDSDLDVRAVYVHTSRNYYETLSMRTNIELAPRSIPLLLSDGTKAKIETSPRTGTMRIFVDGAHIAREFDLSMWDVTKALQLGRSSNASITRWLYSPIVYINRNPQFTKKMRAYVCQGMSIREQQRRHNHGMLRTELQNLAKKPVDVKKAMYLIMPSVRLVWLKEHPNTTFPPPVWCPLALSQCSSIPGDVRTLIDELISCKRNINEHVSVQINIDRLLEWTNIIAREFESRTELVNHPVFGSLEYRHELFLQAFQ